MALDTIAVARAEIAQIYIAAFNRVPDAAGLSNWLNQYTAGLMTYAQIAEDFTHQAEYQAKYPSIMTNTEYVTEIYQNVFGRMPDAGGLTNWVNQLDHTSITGINRGNIMKLMLDAAGATGNTDGERLDNQAAFAVQSILDGVDTDAATAQLANITSDSTTVTTAQTAVSSGAGTAGGTYALTTGTDILNTTTTVAANKTTANDDTIYATTADSFDSDIIDGGAGADSIIASYTANSNTITPTSVTNVETITATVTAVNAKSWTFDAANITGVNTFNLKNAGAVSMSSSDELITVNNLVKTATLGIIGGTASTGTTASEITANFASAAAGDTQKVAISTLGKVGVLTLATATTVELTATGNGTTGANTIGMLTNNAMDKLTIKGSGDITISDITTTTTTATGLTIDASANTGLVNVTGESGIKLVFTGNNNNTTVTAVGAAADNITTGNGNDTVTVGSAAAETVSTGAGNDTVIIGLTSDITVDDNINGGEGTDTLSTSDATLDATDKTALALGTSNFEILNSSAATLVSVDFNALSSFNTVSASAAMAAGYVGDQTTAATNSITVTNMENTDALVIAAARTGQAGGVNASTANTNGSTAIAGGDGINLAVYVDNGSNVANLVFVGNADITGGVGERGDGSNSAGASGDALDAANFETVNMEIRSTMAQNAAGTLTIANGDVVTFAGGAAAAAGAGAAAGSSVIVGTNATINLTSTYGTVAATGATAQIHSSVDLGTIIGTNVTLNGTAFEGNITATAASGNVTLQGGNGIDTLVGGAGIDTLTGGANNDLLTGKAGADNYTGGTGRDAFILTANTESAAAAYDKISDFGKVSAAVTATQTAAMSSVAAFQAAATAQGGANADVLDLASAVALEAAETVDVSAATTLGTDTINAVLSAKGIITLTGDAANVDTLAEWVDVAELVLDSNNDVAAFEFNGNTYILQNTGSDATDQLIELTGVTGVTGLVIAGSSVAAVAGDVFII